MSYLDNPRVVQFLKASGRPVTEGEASKAVDGIKQPLLGNIMVPNFAYKSWINNMVNKGYEIDPRASGTIQVDHANHIEYHGRFDAWLESPEGERIGKEVFEEITSLREAYLRHVQASTKNIMDIMPRGRVIDFNARKAQTGT